MAQLKKKAHIVDEHLVRLADDLVLSILQAEGGHNLSKKTLHMEEAIYAYSEYRKELLG